MNKKRNTITVAKTIFNVLSDSGAFVGESEGVGGSMSSFRFRTFLARLAASERNSVGSGGPKSAMPKELKESEYS